VFDEHKECLLRLGRRSLAIVDSLDEQCPPEGAQPPCLWAFNEHASFYERLT